MQEEQIASLKERARALLNGNRIAEAKRLYVQLCRAAPADVESWITLSAVHGMLGELDEAGECCRHVLGIQPDTALAHRNLGNVLMMQGRQQEALESYAQVLRINPNFPDVYNNRGNILTEQGRFQEARDSYVQAVRMAPSYAEAHSNLGAVYYEMGDTDRAIECCQTALNLNPASVDTLVNLGNALKEKGRHAQALLQLQKALALSPASEKALAGVIPVLRNLDLSVYRPELDGVLHAVLGATNMDHQRLARGIVNHLTAKHGIRWGDCGDGPGATSLVEKLGEEPLFALFLHKTVNTDGRVEQCLTRLRRTLLERHCTGGGLDGKETAAAMRLARQCANNEYVFETSVGEEGLLTALQEVIVRKTAQAPAAAPDLEADLVVYAMYDRLVGLPCRQALSAIPAAAWSEGMAPLIMNTLRDPLREEAIRENIVSLPMADSLTSRAVRSQYEENPYPRWERFSSVTRTRLSRVLKTAFPHFTPPAFLDGPVRILVAGCGTGKQPIQAALQYPHSEVVAVDLSKASLAYAIRMAETYGVDNVRFLQGDILTLGNLDETFHVVMCGGVLHHMEDPLEGWMRLTERLAEDGLMNIALYSEKARAAVVAARGVIEERGLSSGRDDIRRLRGRILRHEEDEALSDVTQFTDFYSLSECRDLLFHVQEHRYTCSRLKADLARLGLEFIGFELPDADTRGRYRERYPEDRDMTDLDRWDRFEDIYPDTFRSMYQFWCRRRGPAA